MTISVNILSVDQYFSKKFFLAVPVVCRSSWTRDGTGATAVTKLEH